MCVLETHPSRGRDTRCRISNRICTRSLIANNHHHPPLLAAAAAANTCWSDDPFWEEEQEQEEEEEGEYMNTRKGLERKKRKKEGNPRCLLKRRATSFLFKLRNWENTAAFRHIKDERYAVVRLSVSPPRIVFFSVVYFHQVQNNGQVWWILDSTHETYSRTMLCQLWLAGREWCSASPSCPIIQIVSRPVEFVVVGLKSYVCSASLVWRHPSINRSGKVIFKKIK